MTLFLQLTNFTPTGLLNDRVLVVNNVVKRQPTNMWQDVIISEGIKEDLATMNAIIDNTPRDVRGEGSQRWTTTDEDGTNMRSHALQLQVNGSCIQVLAIARNLQYPLVIHHRWVHFLIVTMLMASSAPPDSQAAVLRLRNNDVLQAEAFESMSSTCNSGAKQKGAYPKAADRKRFAGVLCCTNLLACNVAMIHKLGAFSMNINYAVEEICAYYFKIIINNFAFIISPEDSNSASRINECLKCRAVAHTLRQRVTQCLLSTSDPQAAQVATIQYAMNNALHMSMVPQMCMNLVQRLVRGDVLLCIVAICEELKVPYIPLNHLLELFNGKLVSKTSVRNTLKVFFDTALQKQCLQPFNCAAGVFNAHANVSLYLSSTCQSARANAEMSDAADSCFRFVPNQAAAGNKLGVPSNDSVISSCSMKLYHKYHTR